MKRLRSIWAQLLALLGAVAAPARGRHIITLGGVCIACGDYVPPAERDELDRCTGPRVPR